MGQYQQWLSAQEVARRLQAEIETLETELFYLQDRITILEQVVPTTDNVILQALTVYLRDQGSREQQPGDAQPPAEASTQGQPVWNESSPPETPPVPALQSEEALSYLSLAYSQREMSEDMLAFFDKQSQTDPTLSALLQRERQRVNTAGENAYLVDEETRRLNESIQRWFVRWHRQTTRQAQAEEVENE